MEEETEVDQECRGSTLRKGTSVLSDCVGTKPKIVNHGEDTLPMCSTWEGLRCKYS